MTAILLDGKNLLYRFGWVFQKLAAPDGRKTGALYGLLNCMLRLKKKYPDARFVLCWDGMFSNSRGWRSKVWSGYKANRRRDGKLEEGVKLILGQQEMIDEMMDLLGIYHVEIAAVEADDVIALLAAQCREQGWQTIVYSSDYDFAQLMAKGVLLIRDAKGKEKLASETERSIEVKFRCSVSELLKVRAIAGDKSDGITGALPGVGVVRAAKYVAAGVDPAFCNFGYHPTHVLRAYRELMGPWPDVHRNYQLMCLPGVVSHSMFGENAGILRDEIESAFCYLQNGNTSGLGLDYRKLMGMLAELGMKDAVARRREVWQLGSISQHRS